MTIEEKAKAYDKALEMAKQYRINAKEAGDYSAVARYENIFPELAESEDERIRNVLYYIVRDLPYMETELRASGLTKEQVLTWLKKQKEPKDPFDDEQFKRGYEAGKRDGYWEGYNKAMDAHNNMVSFHQDYPPKMPDVPTYATTNNPSNVNNLQAEQKPDIELIQKSWYMEGYHDAKFKQEPKWILKTGEGDPKYELNPRYGAPLKEEPKPAEWSEEDEDNLRRVIRVLEDNDSDWKELSEWLKSLKNRGNFPKSNTNSPKWKPSKDEERLINTSISFLKDFADKGYENAVECIDWLKSKLNGNTCE